MTDKTYHGWGTYEAWRAYNGWSTYEAWLVNFWLTNNMQDEDLTASVKEANTTYEAKEILKDYVEKRMPEIEGLFADLLRGALSEVNWYEIVKNWRGEA